MYVFTLHLILIADFLQVPDPKIPSESDNWLIKATEGSDIVYVSSDSGDSNVCQ